MTNEQIIQIKYSYKKEWILYSLSTKARNNLNLHFSKDISIQREEGLCGRGRGWDDLEITPFPQSHSPPFCYPSGPHTGHVSWGKFLCSLFKGKVPPLKLIFYFLLSENGKYATVCFLFWLKCQKTWSQILVTASSWELGSIFLSLSLLPLVGFYS